MDRHSLRRAVDGTWASLLPDLLLDVFRRLDASDVIRCTYTCKPWRGAIIGAAASGLLRPCPDRFLPSLLLGVFHFHGACHYYKNACLRRVPRPLHAAALPSTTGTDPAAAHRFLPAATTAGGKRPSSYGEVLSSRDGFVLLVDTMRQAEGLCLCNLITGFCTFLPIADVSNDCTYVLLTAGDLSGDDDDIAAVRILAIAGLDFMGDRINYQLFSLPSTDDHGAAPAAGTWGPVERSGQLKEKGYDSYMDDVGYVVVCRGGAVHWLAGAPWDRRGGHVTCTVGLDVRTGRVWITELPKQCHFFYRNELRPILLATSGDGELSVVRSLRQGHLIQVWALVADGEWTLRRTVDIQSMLPPRCPEQCELRYTILNAFCPRSGCVIAVSSEQEVRIDMESFSSRPPVERMGDCLGYYSHPYEMDWSTYISRMKKYF